MCVCVCVYIYIYIYINVCYKSKERIKIYFKIGRSTKRFVFLLNSFILFLHTGYIWECFQLVAFVGKHAWHKALLMGYSMRLELTLVCSLNVFQLVRLWVLYKGYSPFFLECVYFSLLYPSLIFDVFVCVCVLEWFWISLTETRRKQHKIHSRVPRKKLQQLTEYGRNPNKGESIQNTINKALCHIRSLTKVTSWKHTHI